MKNVLATSAVGVVCIALAMTFSLTSCQHGDNPIDSLVSKSILGGKNSNIGGVASVRGQDLSPEERKRRIEAFVSRPEIKQTSQGLEELAKLVAIAVEDESLRHRIYERCQEKFDGESNVLWQQLDVDESVRASGGNFSEKIDAIRSRRNIGSVVRNIGSVKSAVTQFEKHFDAPLHLFWMYPSQWDKKTVPFIAFVPRDVDPGTLKSIPAFDANGNRYTLEANGDLAKKHPVIVIAFNERTTIDGRKKLGLLMVNSDSEINDNRKPPKGTASVASLNGLKIQTINLFYPYNQDEIAEWDGAPEFQWDCFFWSQYTHDGGDAPFGSATFPALSGFFGGGGISANAAYLFPNINIDVFWPPHFFAAPDPLHVNPRNFRREWRVCYWEDDGLFIFDDLIARHDWKPYQASGSMVLVGSQPSGNWFLPAEGGTVTSTYIFF